MTNRFCTVKTSSIKFTADH